MILMQIQNSTDTDTVLRVSVFNAVIFDGEEIIFYLN